MDRSAPGRSCVAEKLEDAAVFLFGKTHRADFFHRILEAGLTITT
jgi:hypothetical protein